MVVGNEAADRLEVLAKSGSGISGQVLNLLSLQIRQIIWGEFQAFEKRADKPWVVIRAIDTSWYEVDTEDKAVADLIRFAFNDIR